MEQAPEPSLIAAFLADELRNIFAEERTIISSLLSSGHHSIAADAEPLASPLTRSMRYASTYHLTFSLFTPGSTPNAWAVEEAIAENISPVLDVLAPTHNFNIDTQIQLYATPGVQTHTLNQEDLASFINAAEWSLSPSIGGAQTINFLIFVGNQTIELGQTGLITTSQSWMIPQWGAVYLLDLPATAPSEHSLSNSELKVPMQAFAAYLMTLLGVPHTGSLPLRLSTLSRIRSADMMIRASSTLGSLARLVNALPSIAIPSTVADGVAKTMAHLELACKTLGSPESLTHARIAEQEAEKAFFEKSMVGQLYFPDEHKIAVYLPLLGPIGVPLVLGLLNEFKRWQQTRRERASGMVSAEQRRV